MSLARKPSNLPVNTDARNRLLAALAPSCGRRLRLRYAAKLKLCRPPPKVREC